MAHASVRAAGHLELYLIALRTLMTDLSDRQVRMQVWIVDACRTNPFRVGGKPFGGSAGGLEHSDQRPNSLVWYSANYGQIALDLLPSDPKGVKNGSPYMRAWISMFDEWKHRSIRDFA